jgi:colicin import membrane protein
MSALTFGSFERGERGIGRSFALSALVHIVLAAILFLGVRWQSSAPDTVTVDLVDVAPPPPPVVEAPKPPPKVEAPKPPPPVEKPVPRIEKPQIAIPDKPKPKPKPKPEAKPKAEVKPKADPTFEKRLKEQMALEQQALDQARQERELRELLARKAAETERAAAAAKSKALNEYIARIQAKVKGNWILPQDIQGNPEAVFLVVQLPTGEVLSTRLLKSSGNAAYDGAVERAILKSSPLPLPPTGVPFSRELKLTFRPQDK